MRRSISLLCLGQFAAGASAGDYGSDQKMTFESLDRNSDQQISRSEAKESDRLAKEFAKADLNGDGQLSHEEYEAYTKA
jgi:hypothetical protein